MRSGENCQRWKKSDNSPNSSYIPTPPRCQVSFFAIAEKCTHIFFVWVTSTVATTITIVPIISNVVVVVSPAILVAASQVDRRCRASIAMRGQAISWAGPGSGQMEPLTAEDRHQEQEHHNHPKITQSSVWFVPCVCSIWVVERHLFFIFFIETFSEVRIGRYLKYLRL